MQFGVGILGRGWTAEGQIAKVLSDESPTRVNMHHHAACYAAKIAAESLFAEPPSAPDLSDEGILTGMALCALPVRRAEVGLVRDAFFSAYWRNNTKEAAA